MNGDNDKERKIDELQKKIKILKKALLKISNYSYNEQDLDNLRDSSGKYPEMPLWIVQEVAEEALKKAT